MLFLGDEKVAYRTLDSGKMHHLDCIYGRKNKSVRCVYGWHTHRASHLDLVYFLEGLSVEEDQFAVPLVALH